MTPWERENHCPTKGNDPINHSTSTTKKYAAIYVRVSTEEQAEHGYSLKTQLDACRTLAQREGDTVLESHIFQVTFVIHAEEADIVRRIFRLYVHDGLSLYAIAKQLTEARIPTHRDRRSTGPQRRLTPGTRNPATIFVMLTNKTYIGTYYWNKTESLSGRSNPDKKTRRRLRPKEEWIAIAVPPIIDPETFAAVSSQRHHNARTSRRNSHYEYLLGQGRLHCDVCGCSMAGHCDTRRGAVRSYHCSKPQLC